MDLLKCIGLRVMKATPYVIDILENPDYNPNEYYNVPYIQITAIETFRGIRPKCPNGCFISQQNIKPNGR